MKNKVYNITKERAVEIASNHNNVSLEIAARYTLSELKEVLNHLGIKAKII